MVWAHNHLWNWYIRCINYKEFSSLPNVNTYLWLFNENSFRKRLLFSVCINHTKFQENFTDYFYFHILSRYKKNKKNSTFGNLFMSHNDFYSYIHKPKTVFYLSFYRYKLLEINFVNNFKLSMFNVAYNNAHVNILTRTIFLISLGVS